MSLHWPLKTDPDEYLDKYGLDAKHSALALEILAETESVEFPMSSWKGLPNYHCPFCPAAMLKLDGPDGMRAHVRGHGSRKPSTLEED